jgi:vitamin K-dependent gamma-carboxylase-like protein
VIFRLIAEAWNRFFFAPRSPLPVALFRVVYGVLVMATLLLLRPDWLNWYGTRAWVSLSTMHQFEPGARLNLFMIIPQDDRWIEALFWLFLGSAILLTIGFLTRVNSAIVFLCLASVQQRNLYILHGGDTFLRVAGFFLIFAPAGAALSADRWIRVRRGKEGPAVPPRSPWAQRMIQIELTLLYFAAFCSKAQGTAWLDGTALYYVYRLDELRHFPLPAWFFHRSVLQAATWCALAFELAMGVLIWFRSIRYYLLACGLLFHLFIEYSLNIPLFEWDVLSAYILFIDAADLERAGKWLGGFLPAKLGIKRRRGLSSESI